MNVSGTHYRTIWLSQPGRVRVIDQSRLPFEFVLLDLETLEDAAHAIRSMIVRGAPLIGATAAYGMALALISDPSERGIEHAARTLLATRPTAVDLAWAVARMRQLLERTAPDARAAAAFEAAGCLCDESIARCRAIGRHGLEILRRAASARRGPAAGGPLNILTHCNAGWLACVDWGTALSPVYCAHDAGISVHVWVDETRPRNQGAALTAFELAAHGVPHTVIADNLGGLLMQRGDVDLVLVGADRVTAGGDVCNKVGTYLKALAARDNGVPFYAALPTSTIDWSLDSGSDIPIEERSATELTHVRGRTDAGAIETVRVVPVGSPALNLGFDITPAKLVTAIITERGACAAQPAALGGLRASLGGAS
jgi:methylthioribose-1-phosphate isomerase